MDAESICEKISIFVPVEGAAAVVMQLFQNVIILFLFVGLFGFNSELIRVSSLRPESCRLSPEECCTPVGHEPHAACRPPLDGRRHSSRGAAAAANKGTSPTHCDPQVRILPSTRLAIIHQQPLTRAVWMCVRAVACSSATTRQRRRCANAEARMRRLIV